MLECVTRHNYCFVEQGPGESILQVRESKWQDAGKKCIVEGVRYQFVFLTWFD